MKTFKKLSLLALMGASTFGPINNTICAEATKQEVSVILPSVGLCMEQAKPALEGIAEAFIKGGETFFTEMKPTYNENPYGVNALVGAATVYLVYKLYYQPKRQETALLKSAAELCDQLSQKNNFSPSDEKAVVLLSEQLMKQYPTSIWKATKYWLTGAIDIESHIYNIAKQLKEDVIAGNGIDGNEVAKLEEFVKNKYDARWF